MKKVGRRKFINSALVAALLGMGCMDSFAEAGMTHTSLDQNCLVTTNRTLDDVRDRLESPFMQELLTKTYQSLVQRVRPDGYFQESLTGAYQGMFPRTVGGVGRLFLETGELDKLEDMVNYCLEAMLDNDMERIPHVIAPLEDKPASISDEDAQVQRYKILSDMDQIDGQAHVIMAWAMLAMRRGETEFENQTYPVVAKLMDRSTTEPYLSLYTGARIKLGLVCNVTLEHSRDGQYWHAYDFLTQSFVCSALENMIEVAQRRQDMANAEKWERRLGKLTTNIMQNMTRDFEGRKIFYEMILPTGREPKPFPGMGWLNLAPIPAGWRGVDKQVFKDTVDTWHRVARIEWDGPQMTSSDWLSDEDIAVYGRQFSNQVIGKVLGWDLVYCLRAGEYDRVCDMLDFIKQINTSELYAEAFNYDTQSGNWRLQDPGNGEQACWWCWAMTDIRQEVGLEALPK